MQISDEQLKKFKEIYKKEFGKEISDKEAYESAYNLLNLMDILYKGHITDCQRKERLKKEPKGFHLEGGPYNCFICHDSISDKETWYDKYGIKCLNCQRAQEKKIFPVSAVKNRDSWLADWQLKSEFGLYHQTVRKLIREGKLKPRTVLNKNGKTHFQLFLIKENKEFLNTRKGHKVQN